MCFENENEETTMNEVKKCPKCSGEDFREKRIRLFGSLGYFNPLEAKAQICNKCGYVELYEI